MCNVTNKTMLYCTDERLGNDRKANNVKLNELGDWEPMQLSKHNNDGIHRQWETVRNILEDLLKLVHNLVN